MAATTAVIVVGNYGGSGCGGDDGASG